MNIKDLGIILAVKKYGEGSAVVKIFSKEHGIYSGFVKGVKSKKSAAIYQIGNLVEFNWMAKNSDNLGVFRIELIKSFLGEILADKIKLDCLNSIINLISTNILEREALPELFEEFHHLLQSLPKKTDVFLQNYIHLEISLLNNLGYGIDLSECAATGTSENLAYVSPKSGRAVSFEAGEKYQDKLLKLPKFLLEDLENPSSDDLQNGLKLTGFFLSKYLYLQNDLPNCRLKLNRLDF